MNMKKMAIVGVVCSLFASFGCSSTETLVVFDIQDSNKRLSDNVLEQLTEYLAGVLGQDGSYRVLPPAKSKCIGRDLGCFDQAASEIGGETYLTARILKPGDRCALVLSLHERQVRGAIRSASVQSSCEPDNLLGAIDRAAIQIRRPGVRSPAVRPARVLPVEPAEPEAEPSPPAKPAQPAAKPAPIASARVTKPAAAAQPKPIVKKENAYLSIGSRPWSSVELDGKEIGYTPVVKSRLSTGRHTVMLKTTDGRRKNFRINLKPGEHGRLFGNFDDEPEAEEIPVNGTPPKKTGYGELNINSLPWAKLIIDGEPMGNTPIMGLKLEAGTHHLSLRTNDGFRKDLEIVIRPGKKLTRIVRFPGATGMTLTKNGNGH